MLAAPADDEAGMFDREPTSYGPYMRPKPASKRPRFGVIAMSACMVFLLAIALIIYRLENRETASSPDATAGTIPPQLLQRAPLDAVDDNGSPFDAQPCTTIAEPTKDADAAARAVLDKSPLDGVAGTTPGASLPPKTVILAPTTPGASLSPKTVILALAPTTPGASLSPKTVILAPTTTTVDGGPGTTPGGILRLKTVLVAPTTATTVGGDAAAGTARGKTVTFAPTTTTFEDAAGTTSGTSPRPRTVALKTATPDATLPQPAPTADQGLAGAAAGVQPEVAGVPAPAPFESTPSSSKGRPGDDLPLSTMGFSSTTFGTTAATKKLSKEERMKVKAHYAQVAATALNAT